MPQILQIRPNYNLLNDNIRKAVFVEGSGDVKFWKVAFEKIHGSFPDDIILIPCGGDQVEFFVNAELCRKIHRRFIFIVDSDKGATDYNSKLLNKNALINKVQQLGGEFEVLRKREVENYYSKDAIQRILGAHHALNAGFLINDYEDIKVVLENEIPNNVRSILKFKSKNNELIFNEMSTAEWLASGFAENGTTDLEIIINKILE